MSRLFTVAHMHDPLLPVPEMEPALREMFHRLNNQLGIILAHAELLEAKAPDDVNRARAAQVVASTLDAMSTARALRQRTEVAGI
jgi:two-component sensor histidine kinase